MKEYNYGFNNGMLIINDKQGVRDYCWTNNISIESFNQTVVISDKVEDCSNMFMCCNSFNYSVNIPKSVKTCKGMFNCCISFNQTVIIPDSVKDCSEMF